MTCAPGAAPADTHQPAPNNEAIRRPSNHPRQEDPLPPSITMHSIPSRGPHGWRNPRLPGEVPVVGLSTHEERVAVLSVRGQALLREHLHFLCLKNHPF